jgi:hypothetical protein
MIESLWAWSMIPWSLWNQIVQLKCLFEWDKLDVKFNNDPGCQALYDKATGLIQDLNIYDLFRTQYGNGASSKKRLTEAERERTVIIDGQEKKYKLGYTPAERNPFHKKLQDNNSA